MEDTATYTFDFAQEVSALQESLGPLCDRLIFMEGTVDDGAVTFHNALGREDFVKDYVRALAGIVQEQSAQMPAKGSRTFGFDGEDTTGVLVFIRDNEALTEALGLDNLPLMRLFSLYHETGHALIDIDTEAPAESAGDAYAALRLFQRFGRQAGNFLSLVSWLRAWHAVGGDMEHTTALVLDKIIADAKEQDFSSLTNEDMIAKAQDYAQNWSQDDETLAAAKPFLAQKDRVDFYALAQTSLTSPNDFAFYIGAKIFQPFLMPEGMDVNGHEQHMPDDVRLEIQQAIKARFGGKSLETIFNKKSPPGKPGAEALAALKIKVPKGQQRLVYKA